MLLQDKLTFLVDHDDLEDVFEEHPDRAQLLDMDSHFEIDWS